MSLDLLKDKISQKKIPFHIAITTDGNGRWGKNHGLSRIEGHKKGIEAVRDIVEISVEIKLKHLTFYAFSTENWKRPQDEVYAIFNIILDSLINEVEELHKNNIIVRFLGSRENISDDYAAKLLDTSKKTWTNSGLNLNIAFNYGGRREIIEAVKGFYKDLCGKDREITDLTEDIFERYLYTYGIPDPDLLIRTGGEKRLSNFLTWQSAYSELYFSNTLWPDFSKKEFLEIILDYQNRKRRFGALS